MSGLPSRFFAAPWARKFFLVGAPFRALESDMTKVRHSPPPFGRWLAMACDGRTFSFQGSPSCSTMARTCRGVKSLLVGW